MRRFLKRIFIFAVCVMIFMSLLQPLAAQASSPMTVSAPDSIQVQTGEHFMIPVTVTAAEIEIFLAEVRTAAESGITFESQPVSRIIPAGSSTRLILRGVAHNPGFHRVEIQAFAFPRYPATMSIPMITTETFVEVMDAPGQEPRPRFDISNVSFVPETPDISRPFTLNINLKNIGNKNARDIEAAFNGGNNFTVTTLTNRIRIPSANIGQEVVASFQIRAKDTHESNEVTATFTYGEHTQTETLNLPLPEKGELPERQPPLLKVGSFNIVPSGDNRLSLTLNIQNIGEQTAQTVRLSIDGGDKLFPLETGGIKRISSIAEGASARIEYLLSPRGELVNHPLNIELSFNDSEGKNIKENERIFISSNLEPALKITEFSTRPQGGDGEFLFRFTLQNIGFSPARNIRASFTGTQAFPLTGSNLLIIPDIAAGESAELSLLMKAAQKSETYTIPIELNFVSIGGYEHKIAETITLTAASIGVQPGEDEEDKKGTPRVMLERHTLSEEKIFAGSTFTLALYIRNNADRSVGNIKISLGSIQVTDSAGGGGGGTVFSPLDGSSSSFFVENIAARAQLVKEVTLFVDPNAAARTYALPISIEFEDGEGGAFTVNETVNIPVLQETRIQVLSVDIPTHASAGQPFPVSLEFANTGRVPLNNVMVAIEGAFPKENATYFIPRLEIGMSDYFQGMIIPDAEGTLSGKILLTYLDALNQEVTIEHPISIEVAPMNDTPVDFPVAPPEVGVAPTILSLPVIIGIVIAALLLLTAAFFIVRKIRRRRKADFFGESV